jgi:hypothetical protein
MHDSLLHHRPAILQLSGLRFPRDSSRKETAAGLLSTQHLLRRVVLDVLHAVLLDDLDGHALEVDGQAALQLVRAHAQDLHALVEADVWVVVFVEDGEAVVSG